MFKMSSIQIKIVIEKVIIASLVIKKLRRKIQINYISPKNNLKCIDPSPIYLHQGY